MQGHYTRLKRTEPCLLQPGGRQVFANAVSSMLPLPTELLSTALKPTMYSAGAMYSTLPLHSSGRSAWSMRRPAASNVQKYSTGTSFTMAHTLQE